MYPTHRGELPIPQLPKTATEAHVFHDLGPTSLLSLGKFCDVGCEGNFTATKCTITHQGKEILRGERSAATNNLWTTTLPTANPTALTATTTAAPAPTPRNTPPPDPWITVSPKPGQAMPAVQNSGTQASLIAFAHGALGNPSLSTMETAKDFIPPFPGVTLKSFRKNPPRSEATTMGHLDNIRKNTRSTKKAPKKQPLPPSDPFHFLPQPEDTTRTHTCFLAVTDTKQCVYTDQTGRLPQPSSEGNNFILIAYDYDSNCIFMQPLRNRKVETLTATVAEIHATLSKGGCKPILYALQKRKDTLLASLNILLAMRLPTRSSPTTAARYSTVLSSITPQTIATSKSTPIFDPPKLPPLISSPHPTTMLCARGDFCLPSIQSTQTWYSNKLRKRMGSTLTPVTMKMNLHRWYAAQMIQMTKTNHITLHDALEKKPTLMMRMIHPYLWLLDHPLFWKLEKLY
jgi:hypothetical protein